MSTALKDIEKKDLLKALVYEKVNGKPIYYKDYKLVLKGEKTLEEVMASSGSHNAILGVIYDYISPLLKSKYKILFGETGVRTKRGYRAIDLAIFEKSKVVEYIKRDKIIPICPIVAIEVDTKAEEDLLNYSFRKTEELLSSGTYKVIWIFTSVEKILIAERNRNWIIVNWNEDVEVLENIKFNLNKLLEEGL